MSMAPSRYRRISLGPASVKAIKDNKGCWRLQSPVALNPYPVRLTERLLKYAAEAPDRTFIAKRGPDGQWREVTYAQALRHARKLGQALLDRGLTAERPLMILSENDL